MHKRFTLLLALAAGLTFAAGGPMVVEEPANPAAPPIDPEKESAVWAGHDHAPAPNAHDRDLMSARRKQVEEMAERIREKREAMEQSGGDSKRRISVELKDLILDGEKRPNKGEDQSEKEVRKKEEIREKRWENEKSKAERKIQHGNPGGSKGPKGDPE
jgi:hypothetical protein